MTGLFLRYCWRCNETKAVADTEVCHCCGEKPMAMDAGVLLCALGAALDEEQRRAAFASALDKPQHTS